MTGKKQAGNKTENGPDDYWDIKTDLKNKKTKLFNQVIFRDWCKACGICIAFCPKEVFVRDNEGKPVAQKPADCIGCLFCELHCPDFAITIHERYPDRRRKNNGEK
ncbi:MAG: 2-ketoglutarate oxidoreductase subunit delta [Proteobacteria bacterium]|nr:2-ketoglutarate oxidoreductase subunit delta [Pseudomonadota bacterium]MBU1710170.1 2-ketoglutarate oxidoreductase subunit delta [Pseudomonadota bacterium]